MRFNGVLCRKSIVVQNAIRVGDASGNQPLYSLAPCAALKQLLPCPSASVGRDICSDYAFGSTRSYSGTSSSLKAPRMYKNGPPPGSLSV